MILCCVGIVELERAVEAFAEVGSGVSESSRAASEQGIMGCYGPLLMLFGFGGFPIMVWPHRWSDGVEVAAFLFSLVVSLPICWLAGRALREVVRELRAGPLPAKSWRMPALLLAMMSPQMIFATLPMLSRLGDPTWKGQVPISVVFLLGVIGVPAAFRLGWHSQFPLVTLMAVMVVSGLLAQLLYNV